MTRMPDEATDRLDPDGTRAAPEADPRSEAASLLMEALSRSLQLSGALFFRGEFSAPWAIRSSPREVFTRLVHPDAQRAILFHAVLSGRLGVTMPDGATATFEAGDVAIFPYADQHVMHGDGEAPAVAILDLIPPPPWKRLPSIEHGGTGEATLVACGYLFGDDLARHPVLAAMPALVQVHTRGSPLRDWLLMNLDYALGELERQGWAAGLMANRLPELLFLECLCHYVRGADLEDWSWATAATDPIVGRALGLLHRRPAEAWTLESLARQSGASRSVLAARFRERLGQPPMQYLATWRLQLALRLLRTSDRNLGEIASDVGYGSESAFSRAFKRVMGRSPQAFRVRAPTQGRDVGIGQHGSGSDT